MTDYEIDCNDIINYINEKIKPHSLNEKGKANISVLLDSFSREELIKAIDIGYSKYVFLDKNKEPTAESVEKFLSKIGGIAYNNSQSPVNQKLIHLNNFGKSKFSYWNNKEAIAIFNNYINALKNNDMSEEKILDNLNNEIMDIIKECNNWTEWKNKMDDLLNYLINKNNKNLNSFIMNNNITISKKYEVINKIGAGSFGVTYLAFDERLKKQFVIKEFDCEILNKNDNKKFFQKFIKEIEFLFNLHHENIVSIYDYMINEEKQIGCYIMEYIDGKNIYDYLLENKGNLTNIFIQAITVFKYLESKNICHRDIRINNILVDNNQTLKLIDFGFVKDISRSNSINSATGLVNYPYDWPEELRNKKQKYDHKTEIYFIGELFSDIISNLKIKKFKYNNILKKMCLDSYKNRYNSFEDILKEINNK